MTVITGASSGIGAELARQLSRRSTRLALIGRNLERLQAVASDTHATAYQADLSDLTSIAPLFAKIEAELGAIDHIYLNAGVSETQEMPFDPTLVEKVVRTNLLANVYVLAAVLPGMIQRRRGHIIAISSLAASRGYPRSGAYSASKAALNTFMEGVRVDLRRVCPEIHVTVISPGYIRTPMTDRNQHPMPGILDVDVAVTKILHAVDRHALDYRLPWSIALAARFIHCMPTALYTWVASHIDRPPKKPAT